MPAVVGQRIRGGEVEALDGKVLAGHHVGVNVLAFLQDDGPGLAVKVLFQVDRFRGQL